MLVKPQKGYFRSGRCQQTNIRLNWQNHSCTGWWRRTDTWTCARCHCHRSFKWWCAWVFGFGTFHFSQKTRSTTGLTWWLFWQVRHQAIHLQPVCKVHQEVQGLLLQLFFIRRIPRADNSAAKNNELMSMIKWSQWGMPRIVYIGSCWLLELRQQLRTRGVGGGVGWGGVGC